MLCFIVIVKKDYIVGFNTMNTIFKTVSVSSFICFVIV